MASYCPVHGIPLNDVGACPEEGCSMVPSKSVTALELPKADLARRLGGSALEFLTFFVLVIIGILLSPFTAFISGILSSLFAATYMAIKDMGGGRFSIGKRIARVRLVDVRTGELATTGQALLRNSYYIAGWIMAVLPDPFGLLGVGLVSLCIVADLLMIVASPNGRRIGDLLAKTQAVPVKDRP